jgi:hypothetical protein
MPARIKATGEIVHISTKEYNDNKDVYEALTKGKTTVKDSNGNIFRVSLTDSRYLSGELVGISTGLACMQDLYGNVVKVKKDDPRIKTGELVGICKNKKLYVNEVGDRLRLASTDQRVVSREYQLFDLKKFRTALQNRPEAIALDNLAKSKKVKYPHCWVWATDIKPYLDKINSSPNNTSLVTRGRKASF